MRRRRMGFVGWVWGGSLAVLSACGGGSSGPPTTTVSVSTAALALAARNLGALPSPIPGNARVLTVTNTGAFAAQAVGVKPGVVFPPGTTVVSTCGPLEPGDTCRITITPGTVATPAPVVLSIQGRNTPAVTSSIDVLAYGSVYQGGYLFAIDDNTPNTGSVGGKVAGLTDEVWALEWSPDLDPIAGIDELSTTPCVGAIDGACNTAVIVAHYNAKGVNPAGYAAGACAVSTAGGYADWYLPAICESGFDGVGFGTGCGSQAAPRLQNRYTGLFDNGIRDLLGTALVVHQRGGQSDADPPRLGAGASAHRCQPEFSVQVRPKHRVGALRARPHALNAASERWARARTRLNVDAETPAWRAMCNCSMRRLRSSTMSGALDSSMALGERVGHEDLPVGLSEWMGCLATFSLSNPVRMNTGYNLLKFHS